LNVYTNKFYFMGFKSVSRVHTLLEERRCTVASEPLTEFEIQHPDPKERAAARTWMEFATSFGISPSLAAMGAYPGKTLNAFNNAPRAGKSRLGMLHTLETPAHEIQARVEFNMLPRIRVVAVRK
jgi:hypothetical protein